MLEEHRRTKLLRETARRHRVDKMALYRLDLADRRAALGLAPKRRGRRDALSDRGKAALRNQVAAARGKSMSVARVAQLAGEIRADEIGGPAKPLSVKWAYEYVQNEPTLVLRELGRAKIKDSGLPDLEQCERYIENFNQLPEPFKEAFLAGRLVCVDETGLGLTWTNAKNVQVKSCRHGEDVPKWGGAKDAHSYAKHITMVTALSPDADIQRRLEPAFLVPSGTPINLMLMRWQIGFQQWKHLHVFHSETGWMTAACWMMYLTWLVELLDGLGPIVLMYDLAASHLSLETLKFLRDHNWCSISYPTNSTRLLQVSVGLRSTFIHLTNTFGCRFTIGGASGCS